MKETTTSKKFHKKFTHRLTIKCVEEGKTVLDKQGNDTHAPTVSTVKWFLNKNYAKDTWKGLTINDIDYLYNSGGYYLRQQVKYVPRAYTVYFNDAKVFEDLKDFVGAKNLEAYEKPLSSQHVDSLDDNKVLTRSKLFYDKYRVACRLKNSRGSYNNPKAQEIQDWAKEQWGEDDDRWRVNHNWLSGTVFFRDAKDVMMFKLAFGHDLKTTERIVLLSEITDQ